MNDLSFVMMVSFALVTSSTYLFLIFSPLDSGIFGGRDMTRPVVTASRCCLEFMEFGRGMGEATGRRGRRSWRIGTGMSDSLFQLVLRGQTVCGCVHVMASH